MKKTLLVVCLLVVFLVGFKNKNSNEVIIPKDSIRFRVISNSNNELDIKTKMELKDYLEELVFDLVKDCNSVLEVKEVIINNFDYINSSISIFLNSNDYKVDFGPNYFPKKVYKGVVYDEGIYDSLVITLGNGKGNNWWCVLFPPLCLLEENTTTTDVEYKLFVSRIIESFK